MCNKFAKYRLAHDIKGQMLSSKDVRGALL